jgi:regulator of nucleoside diphosphate kinase
MNSTVRLRQLRSKEIETYTLVYPTDANIAEDKLSVLAPIGTAILGYRVGDRVEWQVPRGAIRFKIEELVFQPERDGVVA